MARHAILPALAILVVTSLLGAQEAPAPYDHGDPTPREQLFLELVNRARIAPDAERIRLGIPASEWPGYAPCPPLALDARLLDAARAHAADMAARRFFSYTNPDGEGSNGRIRAAGYPLAEGYGSDGANQVETIRAQGPEGVRCAHEALLERHGSGGDGIRKLILSDGGLWSANDQAGFGVVDEDVKFDDGRRYAEFYAQEFAHDDDPRPFLLGVAYRDENGSGFYDPGEGLGGVAIETEGGAVRTVTSSAGGYAVPVDEPGEYTLLASGGGLGSAVQKAFSIGGENVKVDIVERVEQSLQVAKSVFKLNLAAAAKGTANADSFKLKAVLNPDGIPGEVLGAPVTLELGDLVLGPFTPAVKGSNASYKSPAGTLPKVAVKLKGKTGVLVVKVARAGLQDGLDVGGADGVVTLEIATRVHLGEPFLATAVVPHDVKVKAGKKASGKSRR